MLYFPGTTWPEASTSHSSGCRCRAACAPGPQSQSHRNWGLSSPHTTSHTSSLTGTVSVLPVQSQHHRTGGLILMGTTALVSYAQSQSHRNQGPSSPHTTSLTDLCICGRTPAVSALYTPRLFTSCLAISSQLKWPDTGIWPFRHTGTGLGRSPGPALWTLASSEYFCCSLGPKTHSRTGPPGPPEPLNPWHPWILASLWHLCCSLGAEHDGSQSACAASSGHLMSRDPASGSAAMLTLSPCSVREIRGFLNFMKRWAWRRGVGGAGRGGVGWVGQGGAGRDMVGQGGFCGLCRVGAAGQGGVGWGGVRWGGQGGWGGVGWGRTGQCGVGVAGIEVKDSSCCACSG